MVTISIGAIVPGADTVAQGDIVSRAISTALLNNDAVCLSFRGIGSVSSSFVSAALIPTLRGMSFDDFKRRVRIVDASWQVSDLVKRRIQRELAFS